VLSASATTASATATACGLVAAGTLTTQMISSAVCALRMLASRPAAAWLAAAANVAGSVWRPACLATRMVMSGARLARTTAQETFRRLLHQTGIYQRAGGLRPRLHDARHTFAVTTLLGWYRDGDDVQARLPLLSTWLGHADPRHTYWYLSAAPELLALVAERLESGSAAMS
jgi:integrase/recombinase XerD